MKKKGFTLVELLAVIAILAIIALIALPTINSLIKETRKKSFIDTAYGIIKAGEQYYAKKDLLEDEVVQARFDFPNNVTGLEISGKLPTGGSMKVDKNGNISLAISNGRYCVKKGINDTEVTLTEDIENCELEKTLSDLAVTSTTLSVNGVDKCATSGVCEPGTAFAIKVNEEDTYKFYVMKDTGSKVTLIMDRNLGNTVPWISDEDYGCDGVMCFTNDKGPVTAINYLDSLTDEEWSNIPKKEYTYSGIGEDGTTRIYEDITRTIRVRMISYDEATSSSGTWLYANLGDYDNTSLPIGYWTSTAISDGSDTYADSSDYVAWFVSYDGCVYDFYKTHSSGYPDGYYSFGVRPVIELSK